MMNESGGHRGNQPGLEDQGRSHLWSPLHRFLSGVAEHLLRFEPLWAIPALAFTCISLLWGLGWSWVGLVIASTALPLRRWRVGYFSRRTPFGIPVVLFFVASLTGVAVSPDRSLSLRALQSVLASTLLYYSLVNIPHPGYVKWGFAFAASGVLVATFLAFREGFTPPPALGGFGNWFQEHIQHLPQVARPSRIVNPAFTAAHGLAIALEMVLLPVAGLLLFSRKAPGRIAAVVAGLPFLFSLLLFGSQAAWLSVSVGVAVLLVWRSRWAVVPLAIMGGLGYLGFRHGWLDPSSFVSEFNPAESLRARMGLWEGAVDVIRRYPIAGCGLGCLGQYSTTTFLSPHNAYLQFYADMGIVGALSLLGALGIGSRMAVGIEKSPREDPWYGFAVGIVAAAVAVAVHSLFEGSPAGIIAETADGYFYIVSPVFAILAGLLVWTWRHLGGVDAS